MKYLHNRLNQLYEQQAREEKKVMDSVHNTISSLTPFGGFSDTLESILKKEDQESYYSKNALTLLINKSIDSVIQKPLFINQTLKAIIKTRFVDVLFSNSVETEDLVENSETEKCKSAQL
jgi:hypothetical protein